MGWGRVEVSRLVTGGREVFIVGGCCRFAAFRGFDGDGCESDFMAVARNEMFDAN